MNTRILAGLLGLLMCTGSMAQSFGDIYEKSMPDNQKINYTYLGESDVIWSKRLYRIIDLREKMNLNLYYPSLRYDSQNNQFVSEMSDGRMNFSGILLNEILAGKVVATDGDAMTIPTTYNDIAQKMNRDTITIAIVGADGQERDSTVTNPEILPTSNSSCCSKNGSSIRSSHVLMCVLSEYVLSIWDMIRSQRDW